ncbi:MAG TPA: adenosylcobinamide-GDP ribazoletransferase [Marmoricola sp.]|nr:adenosylcobinamide-GDP ribazoletransferase [Marmoricola sp.]
MRSGVTRGLIPVWSDALRLAFGTLTAVRVPAPRTADRPRAGWAMTFTPIVGATLAGVLVAALEILADADRGLVAAFLMIGLLALLTRGMHLDGLADAADGLGAAKAGVPDPDRGLEVMRRGDVGPFGVVTLVVILGIQAASLSQLLASRHGIAALVLALVVSRFVLPILCLRGVPAARTDGLAPLVAGSVGGVQAAVSTVLGVGLLTLLWVLVALDHGQHVFDFGTTLAAVGSGLAVGVFFALHCIHRFGGITGDVLGACVELTFTASLMVAAFLV